jgi:hypothetical protein
VWIAPGHGGEWYGGKIAVEGGSISLQAWHELLDALPFFYMAVWVGVDERMAIRGNYPFSF